MFLEMRNMSVKIKKNTVSKQIIKCSCCLSSWSGVSNQRSFHMWSNRDEKNIKGKNKRWKEGTPTVFLKECWKSIGKSHQKQEWLEINAQSQRLYVFRRNGLKLSDWQDYFKLKRIKDRIKGKSWTSWAEDKLPTTKEGESHYHQNFSIYKSGYSFGKSYFRVEGNRVYRIMFLRWVSHSISEGEMQNKDFKCTRVASYLSWEGNLKKFCSRMKKVFRKANTW